MWHGGFVAVCIGFSYSFFDVTTTLVRRHGCWHDDLSALVVTESVMAATVWHNGFVGVGFSDVCDGTIV